MHNLLTKLFSSRRLQGNGKLALSYLQISSPISSFEIYGKHTTEFPLEFCRSGSLSTNISIGRYRFKLIVTRARVF